MSKIAKAVIAAVAVTAISSFAVLADTKAQSGADAKQTEAAPTVTTGSIDNDPPFAQRMNDCMAIWDKGTHMTQAQWRRSCRTTLQSLAD
jgi:Spy/CpxP family protein refolding chaperone